MDAAVINLIARAVGAVVAGSPAAPVGVGSAVPATDARGRWGAGRRPSDVMGAPVTSDEGSGWGRCCDRLLPALRLSVRPHGAPPCEGRGSAKRRRRSFLRLAGF